MRTWDFLLAAGIFRPGLGSMEFGLWGLHRVGRDGDALLVPGGQREVVGTALLVLLAVQLGQQRFYRVGVALGDEHGLPHLHIVRDATVMIHPQLIQIFRLAAAGLRLKKRDALRGADEQIRLDLQAQALIQVLLCRDPQNARFR